MTSTTRLGRPCLPSSLSRYFAPQEVEFPAHCIQPHGPSTCFASPLGLQLPSSVTRGPLQIRAAIMLSGMPFFNEIRRKVSQHVLPWCRSHSD